MNTSVDPTDGPAPLLSILIPLYNREWSIGDCIESIGGLADLPAEVIVVDDGSSDASVERAHARVEALNLGDRVRIVRQPNGGPGAARNRAAAEARAPWLVFLDSDDLWQPWTLSELVMALGRVPEETELAYFSIQPFSDAGELARVTREDTVILDHPSFLAAVRAQPGMRYGTCNAAVRRAAFERVGGFSTALRSSEDTDLFLRVGGATRLVTRPVMAGLRRAGQDSLSGDGPAVARGFDWMMRANAEGRYPGPAEELRNFLALSCAYAIRMSFASGRPGLAYGLYARNIGLLRTPAGRKYLWRLPLTPVLNRRDPQAYPFRLRPARKRG